MTYAGIKVMVTIHAKSTPNATKMPNTCTGGIGVSASEAKPAADVSEVNSIGRKRVCMTWVMVFRRFLVSWYRSKNSERICTESSTAMGMMKMGIMLLMMCTVLPVVTSRPIVKMTETIATIMGEMMSISFRKKSRSRPKMTSIAKGAEIAI